MAIDLTQDEIRELAESLPSKEALENLASTALSAAELARMKDEGPTDQQLRSALSTLESITKPLLERSNTLLEKKITEFSNVYFGKIAAKYIELNGAKLVVDLHDFDRSLNMHRDTLERLEGQISSLKNQTDILKEQVADRDREIQGYKTSIVEALKLDTARRLWGDRAKDASVAFWCSGAALLVMLIGFPALAIWEADVVFAFLRTMGSTVFADLPVAGETVAAISLVSRLILITLPIALYIWLIRIMVRFNMRSLLLMDDAAQRKTMLDTYLHLVEQDATVKAERPLILEALFRRTPGHGADSIEPPNLSEVMKLSGQKSPL